MAGLSARLGRSAPENVNGGWDHCGCLEVCPREGRSGRPLHFLSRLLSTVMSDIRLRTSVSADSPAAEVASD